MEEHGFEGRQDSLRDENMQKLCENAESGRERGRGRLCAGRCWEAGGES